MFSLLLWNIPNIYTQKESRIRNLQVPIAWLLQLTHAYVDVSMSPPVSHPDFNYLEASFRHHIPSVRLHKVSLSDKGSLEMSGVQAASFPLPPQPHARNPFQVMILGRPGAWSDCVPTDGQHPLHRDWSTFTEHLCAPVGQDQTAWP